MEIYHTITRFLFLLFRNILYKSRYSFVVYWLHANPRHKACCLFGVFSDQINYHNHTTTIYIKNLSIGTVAVTDRQRRLSHLCAFFSVILFAHIHTKWFEKPWTYSEPLHDSTAVQKHVFLYNILLIILAALERTADFILPAYFY